MTKLMSDSCFATQKTLELYLEKKENSKKLGPPFQTIAIISKLYRTHNDSDHPNAQSLTFPFVFCCHESCTNSFCHNAKMKERICDGVGMKWAQKQGIKPQRDEQITGILIDDKKYLYKMEKNEMKKLLIFIGFSKSVLF